MGSRDGETPIEDRAHEAMEGGSTALRTTFIPGSHVRPEPVRRPLTERNMRVATTPHAWAWFSWLQCLLSLVLWVGSAPSWSCRRRIFGVGLPPTWWVTEAQLRTRNWRCRGLWMIGRWLSNKILDTWGQARVGIRSSERD